MQWWLLVLRSYVWYKLLLLVALSDVDKNTTVVTTRYTLELRNFKARCGLSTQQATHLWILRRVPMWLNKIIMCCMWRTHIDQWPTTYASSCTNFTWITPEPEECAMATAKLFHMFTTQIPSSITTAMADAPSPHSVSAITTSKHPSMIAMPPTPPLMIQQNWGNQGAGQRKQYRWENTTTSMGITHNSGQHLLPLEYGGNDRVFHPQSSH
jgi:hypothetical protein